MSFADETAFAELAEPHRRELEVHVYRMLGSFEEAEDLVQETFLRAWRSRESFEGRSSVRTWLYRIATNVCLDRLKRRPRQPTESGEVLWLEPIPDTVLDEVAADEAAPADTLVAKETVELAFIVAIQRLPPVQRAALLVRDVLGWSARETAELLDTTVPAANSALQRGRDRLREYLPERRSEWSATSSAEERELLDRYVVASEEGDGEALLELMREDARFTMPPTPGVYVGAANVLAFWREGGFGTDELGRMRCRVTRANRQPAVGFYVQAPGASEALPLSLDVLRFERGGLAEIVTFPPEHFPAFGLPPRL